MIEKKIKKKIEEMISNIVITVLDEKKKINIYYTIDIVYLTLLDILDTILNTVVDHMRYNQDEKNNSYYKMNILHNINRYSRSTFSTALPKSYAKK